MSPLDPGADDERLRSILHAFADHVELPASASVIDEPVTMVEVAYDGNTRRGLTARCRTGRGREHVVALADVRFPAGSEAARLLAGYRNVARPRDHLQRSDPRVACARDAVRRRQ